MQSGSVLPLVPISCVVLIKQLGSGMLESEVFHSQRQKQRLSLTAAAVAAQLMAGQRLMCPVESGYQRGCPGCVSAQYNILVRPRGTGDEDPRGGEQQTGGVPGRTPGGAALLAGPGSAAAALHWGEAWPLLYLRALTHGKRGIISVTCEAL